MNKEILEPKKEFNNYYNEVAKNASSLFNNLKKSSNVDESLNKSLVNKYKEFNSKVIDENKIINSYKNKKTLLIILLILIIITVIVLYALKLSKTILILSTIGGIIISIVFIYLITKLNKNIDNIKQSLDDNIKKRDDYKAQAYESIYSLTSSFDELTPLELIKKSCPIIELDNEFDIRKYSYMKEKYGLLDITDINRSIFHCLSGMINGNPFFYQRIFETFMVNTTYRGSLPISWIEHERDSEGHDHIVHRSEILYATVEMPKPEYHMETSLIYANDAAPNLSFTRYPTGMDGKSEKEIQSFVKKQTKKLNKKENKELTDNDDSTNYQMMGNEEFECVFNATNRNDEREFRLLFTPLAQNNLLSLLEDKQPFGDDFNFKKRGPINIIKSKHMQNSDLYLRPESYLTFDLEQLEFNFVEYTKNLFKNIYFDLAPLLSIPLYQMYKPREYIYNTEYLNDFNFSIYEDESIVNKFNKELFKPDNAVTPSILKVKGVRKEGEADILNIRAYSYTSINRTTTVPVMGGDRRIHNVPVHYIEYIPVMKDTFVTLLHSSFNKNKLIKSNSLNGLSELMKEFGSKNYIFHKGILAIITNRNYNSSIIQEINKYINNKEI